MRVAPHELFDDAPHDVVGTEFSLAPGELAQKHHLEREIAELFLELREISGIDGVDHLARFFEHVASQRAKVLLAVPGAAVGREQPAHERDERGIGLAALFGDGRRFRNVEGAAHGARLSKNGGPHA